MRDDVIVYGLSTCVHCQKARELLESLLGEGNFRMIYMDRLIGDERNDRMRELRRHNSELSFPTIVIGEAVVLGNKEEKIRELLAE